MNVSYPVPALVASCASYLSLLLRQASLTSAHNTQGQKQQFDYHLLLPFYQLPQADADAVFNFTLTIPPCAHAQLVLLNLS